MIIAQIQHAMYNFPQLDEQCMHAQLQGENEKMES